MDHFPIPKTPQEEYFAKNTEMLYLDEPFYDFAILRECINPIFIEVLSLESQGAAAKERTNQQRLRFMIKKGYWNKVKGSDIVLAHIDPKIWIGISSDVNRYIQENMTEIFRKNSYKRRANKGYGFRRSPNTLQEAGVMTSIPDSEVSKLENAIMQIHDSQSLIL